MSRERKEDHARSHLPVLAPEEGRHRRIEHRQQELREPERGIAQIIAGVHVHDARVVDWRYPICGDQAQGFSPVWVRSCRGTAPLLMKRMGHMEQA